MKKTCFIVENLTNTTIILPDLRATEIGPLKSLDLEKVARRIDIDRSLDLVRAIKAKLLKVIKRIKPPEKIKIEKPLTRDELSTVIEKATREAMERSQETGQTLDVTKLQESIKRQVEHSINSQLGGKLEGKIDTLLKQKEAPATQDERFDVLLDAIKSLKESIPRGTGSGIEQIGPEVDIAELAKITQKGVESISSEISQKKDIPKKSKRIKLDTQAHDLAQELD